MNATTLTLNIVLPLLVFLSILVGILIASAVSWKHRKRVARCLHYDHFYKDNHELTPIQKVIT